LPVNEVEEPESVAFDSRW